MKKRSTLAVASVLVSMSLSGTPTQAAGDPGFGATCGLVAASSDGYTWQGEIWGGPWFAGQPDDLVGMRCILQQLTEEGWVTIAENGSRPTPLVTAVPPSAASFVTLPIGGGTRSFAPDEAPADLQMCTEVTIYRDPSQPPEVHPIDGDEDPSNGRQCSKAQRAEHDLIYLTVVPQDPTGHYTCAWTEPQDVPDVVPDRICIP